MREEKAREFLPCPFCKQYSHSISDDELTTAFMHFQSLIAHPVRGHPMGNAFDDKTRDAAQVLMAAARAHPSKDEALKAESDARFSAINPEGGQAPSVLCVVDSYWDAHEAARELGFPSLTEALEALSSSPTRVDVLEEAAKIADEVAAERWFDAKEACQHIAKEIRALSVQGEG